jgi:hypothetical protein
VDQRAAAVDPKMRLHAEILLVAFFRLMHLGIARLVGILCRRRRIDDRRIDHRAGGHLKSVRRQVPVHLVEQSVAQIVLLQQMAKAAHRRLIGHRLAAEVDANKRRIACESQSASSTAGSENPVVAGVTASSPQLTRTKSAPPKIISRPLQRAFSRVPSAGE